MNERDLNYLLSDMDASKWAREFVGVMDRKKQFVGTPEGVMHPDELEGWMLSWFACAIMCGYDEAMRRAKADSPTL